jgi:hypothetical protein
MPTANYQARTEQNVIDSDGTLILSHGPLTGGSAFTEKMARKHLKTHLDIDLTETSRVYGGPIHRLLDRTDGDRNPECGRPACQ